MNSTCILFAKRTFGIFSILLSALYAFAEGMYFAQCYIRGEIHRNNASVIFLIVVWLLCGLFYAINNHNKIGCPIAWGISFIYSMSFYMALKYVDHRLGILHYSTYIGGCLTILSLLIFVPDDARYLEKEVINCRVIDGCIGLISTIMGCVIMFQSGEYWELVLNYKYQTTVIYSSLVMAIVWILAGCVLVGVKNTSKTKYIFSTILYFFSGIYALFSGDLHEFLILKYYIILAIIMCIVFMRELVYSDRRKML